ncbi:MAG TPA: hypothetical protein VNZ64_14900, partial [Candidatus Acidoferrum sp.]|nr:hypothetical protein [Candidatus Acidoferrum sp.]
MSFPFWPPKLAGKCQEFPAISAPRSGSLMVANTCMHRVAMQRWIGVGMAQVRHPSLRTGRADFPHPALQLV